MKKLIVTLIILLIGLTSSFGNEPEKLWFGDDLLKYDGYYLVVDDNQPNNVFSYRFYDNIKISFLKRSARVTYPLPNFPYITNKRIISQFSFNIKNIYISYDKNNEVDNIIFEIEGVNNNELLYFKYDNKNINNFPFLLQKKPEDLVHQLQLINIEDYKIINIEDYKINRQIEENKQKEFRTNNFIGFGYMTMLPNTYNRFNILSVVDNFIFNFGISTNKTINGFMRYDNDFNIDLGYIIKSEDILIGITIGTDLMLNRKELYFNGFSGGLIVSTIKYKVNPFIQLRSNGIYSIGIMF